MGSSGDVGFFVIDVCFLVGGWFREGFSEETVLWIELRDEYVLGKGIWDRGNSRGRGGVVWCEGVAEALGRWGSRYGKVVVLWWVLYFILEMGCFFF